MTPATIDPPPTQIETVHLIFKTHLDIGFTDFAHNVAAQYHTGFIPQALATAQTLRERGGPERLIWTTGSWLIYEHLAQATPDERARLEQAIADGDIAWHGLPFTTHSELMDRDLFAFGLSLSTELDQRFGKHTIAAKMTDVPGHTRGIVPLLAAAGIKFLHIGVNPASTPPDVPPVFVWRDPASSTDVVVMYHRGSYGALMTVPGMTDAIAFAHTNDNHGPHTADEVVASFRAVQAQFPQARVIASTLDAYAARLMAVKDTLPVVEAEIGDTWIHGVGSDPLKVGQFRALQRLRTTWLTNGAVQADDPALNAFSRRLFLVPEHTWGLDEKTYLHDDVTYTAADFRPVRHTGKFDTMEESWAEQRAYIDEAVAALGSSVLAREARTALKALRPSVPNLTNFKPLTDRAAHITTPHFEIGFDPFHGSITHLVSKVTGRTWADGTHPLALFGYQAFGQADFDRFMRQYLINLRTTRDWALEDYGKTGLGAFVPEGQAWAPQLTELYQHYDGTTQHFVADMAMPWESTEDYGAPHRVILRVDLPDDTPELRLTLQWFDKAASRLPEAAWLSFIPRIRDTHGWRLDKMGTAIDPHAVVRNGNRKLHAVGRGAFYRDNAGSFDLETLDAPLIAPGDPSLLDFNNRPPAIARGMHVNLLNNIWGTNFRMWYEDNTQFRFVLRAT